MAQSLTETDHSAKRGQIFGGVVVVGGVVGGRKKVRTRRRGRVCPSGLGLKDGGDRRAIGQGDGAAFTVLDGGVGGDAEGVVDGRRQIGGRDGILGGEGGVAVGAAVDGAAANAAPGEECGVATG